MNTKPGKIKDKNEMHQMGNKNKNIIIVHVQASDIKGLTHKSHVIQLLFKPDD